MTQSADHGPHFGVEYRYLDEVRRHAKAEKRGEDCAIGPVQPGPGIGAAQHGDLVPQHEQLGVLGG